MSNQRTLIKDTGSRLHALGIPLFGHYDHKSAENKLDVHDHGSHYEICYLEKGMQPYYIHSASTNDSQLYRLYGGEVFITYPHERHSTGDFHQLRGRMYWIHLDADCTSLLGLCPENIALLKSALAEIGHRIIRIPRAVSDRFKEAFMLLHQPSEERIFRACQLISLFLMELSAQSKKIGEQNLGSSAISEIGIECMSFIYSNILSPELDVQMIADHLHYSRSYVMTAFRREIGMSIHEYILNKKIEYACELLESHSITEIAFLLGFSSSQHFSRVFKNHTKATPRAYKLSRSKQQNGV